MKKKKLLLGEGKYRLLPSIIVVAATSFTFWRRDAGVIGWVAYAACLVLLAMTHFMYSLLHEKARKRRDGAA